MSFLDNLFTTGPAVALKTPTSQIDVSSSAPALNRVLTVTSLSPLQATWEESGSAVGSVFGRVGDVTAEAGDYAASEVDNDSAVSGATVQDALEALQTAIAALSGSPTKYYNPWVPTAPESPDPFDDEFVDGDPDLAARGWTFIHGDNGGTMIRDGDVDPAIATDSYPDNHYRSTITPMGLILQTKTIATLYKAVSGSFSIYHEIEPMAFGLGSVNGSFEARASVVFENLPPIIDNSQRSAYVAWQTSYRGGRFMETGQSVANIGSGASPEISNIGWLSWNAATSTIRSVTMDIRGRMSAAGKVTKTFDPKAAGMTLRGSWVQGPAFWCIRCVRKYPADTFPGLAIPFDP